MQSTNLKSQGKSPMHNGNGGPTSASSRRSSQRSHPKPATSPAVVALLLAASLMPAAYSRTGAVAWERPTRFELNAGQAGSPEIRYYAAANGYRAAFLSSSIAIAAIGEDPIFLDLPAGEREPCGIEEAPGRSHYLIGPKTHFRTDVPAYRKILYANAWQGVDLVVRARSRSLELLLDIAKGDPPLNLGVRNAQSICLNDGAIEIATASGVLTLAPPIARQAAREVEAWYEVEGDRTIRILLGPHDETAPLVVDPVLTASSYLGGSGFDEILAMTRDSAGNIFLVGTTESPDFPLAGASKTVLGGTRDAFVTEVGPSLGNIVRSTYFGGSSYDSAYGVAFDGTRILVCGETNSDDFPTSTPFQSQRSGYQDAFLAALTLPSLSLEFSTYLGGSSYDRAIGVAAGASHGPVVVGRTSSTDFPVKNPLQQTPLGTGFLTKFKADGTALTFSTTLGTTSQDRVSAVDVDRNERIYVSGAIDTYWGEDAFLWRIASDGSRYSFKTDLGEGEGTGVRLDSAGNAYVAVYRYCQQCWEYGELAKVDPHGNTLWSLLLTRDWGTARAVDVDDLGYAYVVGSSNALYQSCSLQQPTSWSDAYLARIAPDGSVSYATYLGGSGDDEAMAVTVDKTSGAAYVAGYTDSSDFPTLAPFQSANGGGTDAFVARIVHSAGAPASDFTATPRVTWPNRSVSFESLAGCDLTALSWDLGDGSGGVDPTLTHSYSSVGTYTVSLAATNAFGTATEVKPDFISIVDLQFEPLPSSGLVPLTVYFNNLTTGPVTGYLWDFADGSTSTATSPTHTFRDPDWYYVCLEATTPSGTIQTCDSIDALGAISDFDALPSIGKAPLTVHFQDRSQGNPTSWSWYFGDGEYSSQQNPIHTFSSGSRYRVSLRVSSGSSSDTAYGYVEVTPEQPENILAAPGPDPGAAPHVITFDALGTRLPAPDIIPYGASGFGATVTSQDIDGALPQEILTGPGPGPVYGPQVRGFANNGSPIAAVNFFAYGTLRYGVTPATGLLDKDLPREILTGAGPGAVFGPHVRGFDYTGRRIAPLKGLSFFAYKTLKWGVNIAGGTVQGNAHDEILTGPGPGPAFGANIRGFAYGPPVTSLPRVNFVAFPSVGYGVNLAASDVDADGFHEILAAPGPAPSSPTSVCGFNLDGGTPVQILTVTPGFGGSYGYVVKGGELDGHAKEEILVGHGPGPAEPANLETYTVSSGTGSSLTSITAFPSSFGVQAGTGFVNY